MTLSFQGRQFTHDFQVADVTQPLLGRIFFGVHGLLIDVANKQIVDAYSSATIPTKPATLNAISGLAYPVRNRFVDLLASFPEFLQPNFSSSINKHGVVLQIKTTGRPLTCRPRRLTPEKEKKAKEEFQRMLKMGIVRCSRAPWASPLLLVPKDDGSFRPCGDYRRLNLVTEADKYPLPHIHDFTSDLRGVKIFSQVILVHGYHQIPVREEHIPKMAVTTSFGLFEYLQVPFGLKNAGACFQSLIDSIFSDLPFVFAYLDCLSPVHRKTNTSHISAWFFSGCMIMV